MPFEVPYARVNQLYFFLVFSDFGSVNKRELKN